MTLYTGEVALFVVHIAYSDKSMNVRYNAKCGSRTLWIPHDSIAYRWGYGKSVSLLVLQPVALANGEFVPAEEFSGSHEPVRMSDAEERMLETICEKGPEDVLDTKLVNVVKPADVDNDGHWSLPGLGPVGHVLGQKLEPVGRDGEYVEVLMMYNVDEDGHDCLSCGAQIQVGRCVFVTEEGYELYPCNCCDEWIWMLHGRVPTA